MEGIHSPAEGHIETGKGHIIKTRDGVVVLVAIFIGLFIGSIRWWHRPTDCSSDCEVFLRVLNSTLMWPRFCSF